MTGPTTRAIHTAERLNVVERPSAMPIYQASTFLFDDMDAFAEVAQKKTSGGYLYTRWTNPSVDAAAMTIAALEGAEASLCFSSGMSAISTTFLALGAGGKIVIASQLYGGTHSALTSVAARAGIGSTLVDAGDPASAAAAIDSDTRFLYCETIGNPAMSVSDIDAWAAVAQEAGVPLVVDATFTPPVMLRAIEHGADLVIHSTTKYLGGHSDHLGGVASGRADLVERLHRLQIDLGCVMAPFEAFLLQRGMHTLDLRFERQASNALRIARWLSSHPNVDVVRYPGLESHPDHELARKLFGDRFGGMLAMDVVGGKDAGRKLMEKVKIFGRAASLGGTKSLIVHPASVTHTQLDEAGLAKAGLGAGTLRVSVGIEDVDDLLADLDEAMS